MPGRLSEYQEKRDFTKTPEPRGKLPAAAGRSFAVQKHDATRLHYDFRLEHDGVLKSWAVPKGPSLDPSLTRLAVEVEDHPLDYGDFEGVIPKGQYGGGSVIVWDRGTWHPEEDPAAGLKAGKLHFRLDGDKLRGRWLLVRTGGSGRASDEGKPQWLLRKLDDGEARAGSGSSLVDERPESVVSGRTVEEVAGRPERVWQSDRRRTVHPPDSAPEGKLPAFVAPQLATLVDKPPAGPGWVYEMKLDGYRCLCRLAAGRAQLLTRRENDWSARFGRLASQAAFLPVETALLDGEAVWLDEGGRSNFGALQKAMGEGDDRRLYYYAFDLLHLDGRDLRPLPLVERKALLAELLAAAPEEAERFRLSEHLEAAGEEVYRRACELGFEGILAKRAAASYRSRRNRDWLKVKCLHRQELVVVGYTDPEGSRRGIGALVVAVNDPEAGGLRFAGRVGTGFDTATLRELRARLEPLTRRRPPLAVPPPRARARGVHWVEPELVAEVAFSEWTGDGVLRHPSYQGLREDKVPAEVVREEPVPPPPGKESEKSAARGAGRRGKSEKKAVPAAGKRRSGALAGRAVRMAGVALSNPDRVFWPDAGITKRRLAAYYERVAERMLPLVAGRPLSLLRCPEGIAGDCFYQKHLAEGAPEALGTVAIEERSGEEAVYLTVGSAAGLVTLAQMGMLEIHTWGSQAPSPGRPDRLVFDLDPGPGVSWEEVITAGRELRELLAGLDLASFPLLTGGKGLHLVVPIAPVLGWDAAKALARALVGLLAAENKDRYTLNAMRSQRDGRIYLDYLRNGFGATAIAPYSTRARPGAPVATPVRWDEVSPRRAPNAYTLANIGRRLRALRDDPWEGAATLAQRLRPEILDHLGVAAE